MGVAERAETRRESYGRQIRDAKLSLFIWRSPGCTPTSVRELDIDQVERALEHFERRAQECRGELARREGEPRLWT